MLADITFQWVLIRKIVKYSGKTKGFPAHSPVEGAGEDEVVKGDERLPVDLKEADTGVGLPMSDGRSYIGLLFLT